MTSAAKDLGNENEQSITITDSERMSDSEIDQAICDAEQYAAQDKIYHDGAVAREETYPQEIAR